MATRSTSVSLRLRAPERSFHLPAAVKASILDAIRHNRFAIGMDYDRTMVNTDEKNRIFPPLAEDKSGVIAPLGALCMLGIPIAIFSGNKPSYLRSLGVAGLRSWLQARGKIEAMQNFCVYSQNSTWLTRYDSFGNEIESVSDEYAKKYLFPPQHIEAIEDAFRFAIDKVTHSRGVRFMKETPMLIRPEGSKEEHKAYGPIFEKRGNVQLSWIAVPGGLREEIIKEALKKLSKKMRALYHFEPGGQFSVDINHKGVAKHIGTLHFRKATFRKDADSSLLMYFGDSVYERGGYKGNDLPVIDDPNAVVFAVNPDQSEIPEHDRIIKAGIGPDATAAWLTWVLTKYASIRFATKGVTLAEKMKIIEAITASGLVEEPRLLEEIG